ncbi:MAG: hypothetical protein FWG36_10090 [Oscillospiraceae bacterium]|nr:hypothetical protein [Oscillospiraceae bacterium]
MKINQPPINSQSKLPIRENTGKAAELNKEDPAINAEKEGVTLSVSHRNDVTSVADEAEKPAVGVKQLLEQLLSSPEDTASLHSGLTPDKVLQLIR